MSSSTNKKRFLVIGSNSFSGSNFVSGLLDQGHDVFGVSRSNQPNKVFLPYLWEDKTNFKFKETCDGFNFKSFDLNQDLELLINFIDAVKPQYIVNFAAQGMVAESWLNPTNWYKTNILSQVALHDELRKKKYISKYVHVTTPEVYGSTDEGWQKESFVFNPSTPYAVSRAACDMHLMSFFKAYDFPVVFTRAANVYGPGQQLYRIVPRTFLSALTGKKINLHGGGISERSFIHIEDVVDITIKIALNADPGTSWHLSTKEAISIKSLVQKICDLTGVDFESIVNVGEERLGKDLNYLLDSTKVRNEFKWEEKYSLHEGLTSTCNWVKSNLLILKDLSWEYIHKS